MTLEVKKETLDSGTGAYGRGADSPFAPFKENVFTLNFMRGVDTLEYTGARDI